MAGHLIYNTKLTKQQFKYIKSSISMKIGLLIEGILSIGKMEDNLRDIVRLNLLKPKLFYRKSDIPSLGRILDDL